MLSRNEKFVGEDLFRTDVLCVDGSFNTDKSYFQEASSEVAKNRPLILPSYDEDVDHLDNNSKHG